MSKREKASFVINLLGTIRARNNNKRRTRLVRTLESEIRCKVLFRVEKNLSPFSRNNCDSVEIPRIPGWPCSLFLVGTIIITGQSFLHQVCGHTSGHTFFFSSARLSRSHLRVTLFLSSTNVAFNKSKSCRLCCECAKCTQCSQLESLLNYCANSYSHSYVTSYITPFV